MLWRVETYLEVEGASLRGILELGVLVTLLEQSVELWYGQQCSILRPSQKGRGVSTGLTSRSSSLLRVLGRFLLSVMAFSNSADLATMFAVDEVFGTWFD
jgi:hypothetical protein